MKEENFSDSETEDNLKFFVEASKQIPTLYNDIARPSVKIVGEGLEVVTKFILNTLIPLKKFNWEVEKKYEKFIQDDLAPKIQLIPKSNIVTPPLRIAGPIFEETKFTMENAELRNLYANLLANAMNKETIKQAHPAFIEIIKNLSVDEAKILKLFTNGLIYPVVDIFKTSGQAPIETIKENYCYLHIDTDISDSELNLNYINNLCRLGIMDKPSTNLTYMKDIDYEKFYDDPFVISVREKFKNSNPIRIDKKILKASAFGNQFIMNVVKDIE